MWVVKLGGSLARSPRLQVWLAELAEHGAGQAIIVPGGGPFADLVRAEQARVGFRDSAAHPMAILGMEQFGFMLEGLHPDLSVAATELELRGALANGRVPVWLAYPMIIRDVTLPQDWSVTADSLALWLAIHLKAEALLLVKSATLDDRSADIESLSAGGALDSHFPGLARQYAGEIRWLGPGECAQIKNGFATGVPPGMPLILPAQTKHNVL
jgi:aspartokinase-like uncharacterized kinase